MANCTLNITDGIQIFQLATSIPTFIMGVLGNAYILIMFCRQPRSEWNYVKIYITNMAIADCILLVILPIKIASFYQNLEGTSQLWDHSNKELCYVLVSVYYVNMYVSIFTVTAISVVRYVAIKFPMKASGVLSCRRAMVVCALIWVVNCSFSAAFHRVDDPKQNATIKCFQKNKTEELPLVFILVLNIVGFLLPVLIMLYCSIKVIAKLRKELEIGSRVEKVQCIFIIAANLVVFVICFFPVHLGFLFKYITQANNYSCDVQFLAHNFVHGAMCISSMNCGLDSFSYYFATKRSWNMCCTDKTRNEEYECVSRSKSQM
ncbi:G-protein coupled receptor 55-like [Xyrauchen texanus]|uniref:G-protein coupled receptor 55-like n=1 Tax=Xyrauchen texanus TaxID=154827 RepID=UPI002241F632|nr:G-protein coupled receptor 55-like [Xyrauchen texanus]